MNRLRFHLGLIFALTVLVTLSACLPVFPRVDPGNMELTSLPVGEWVAVPLGASAMSSDGSPYELAIKRGTSANLVIYFAGGGAAWDADSAFHPLTLASIRRPEKIGGRAGFYSANISPLAPLLMTEVDKLLVAGQSAGGFAAAAWFDRVASRYPSATLYQYSDSSFLVSQHADEVVRDVWKAQPRERFGLGSTVNVLDSALAAQYPNFHYYLTDYGLNDEGKTTHTLAQAESFYDSNEDGVSLSSWLADAVVRDEPRDVGLRWLE